MAFTYTHNTAYTYTAVSAQTAALVQAYALAPSTACYPATVNISVSGGGTAEYPKMIGQLWPRGDW